MTNEKEIIINGNIPYDLSIKMFGEADATSKETNLSASVKLIDSKGTVYMLIECETRDISSEDNQYVKGCFIRRFEYEKRLINTRIWADTINSFVTSVKYSMVPIENDRFLSRYRYIWAQTNNGYCIIAEVLGLAVEWKDGEITTYKAMLPTVD